MNQEARELGSCDCDQTWIDDDTFGCDKCGNRWRRLKFKDDDGNVATSDMFYSDYGYYTRLNEDRMIRYKVEVEDETMTEQEFYRGFTEGEFDEDIV